MFVDVVSRMRIELSERIELRLARGNNDDQGIGRTWKGAVRCRGTPRGAPCPRPYVASSPMGLYPAWRHMVSKPGE